MKKKSIIVLFVIITIINLIMPISIYATNFFDDNITFDSKYNPANREHNAPWCNYPK